MCSVWLYVCVCGCGAIGQVALWMCATFALVYVVLCVHGGEGVCEEYCVCVSAQPDERLLSKEGVVVTLGNRARGQVWEFPAHFITALTTTSIKGKMLLRLSDTKCAWICVCALLDVFIFVRMLCMCLDGCARR